MTKFNEDDINDDTMSAFCERNRRKLDNLVYHGLMKKVVPEFDAMAMINDL